MVIATVIARRLVWLKANNGKPWMIECCLKMADTLIPMFGETPVGDFGVPEIEQWRNTTLKSGSRQEHRKGKKVSAKWINQQLNALKACLKWAVARDFHDVKEVWGSGEQQVRNLWSNVGCWNLCGWLYALVELACWDEPAEALADRADRPWDNPARRPSHADRRRRIVREMLREEFLNHLPADTAPTKIRAHLERLLALAS